MTTREEIIAAAKEAGFNFGYLGFVFAGTSLEAIERLYKSGAASRDAEIQRLQMALADAEALEIGTAEKCDQLRAELAAANMAAEMTRRDCLNLTEKVIPNIKRELEQQLANSQKRENNAIAACKAKDESLEICKPLAAYGVVGSRDVDQTKFQVAISKALTIQPDDSALKAWLGEPVARLIPVALQDGYRVWARTFDEYSQESSENNAYRNGPEIPLYSPKVLP